MIRNCILMLGIVRLIQATTPECRSFEAIYGTGEQLCNTMWGGAFVYTTDESNAYTMWFFDDNNPNDAVTEAINASTGYENGSCHLDYYHKDAPSPEGSNFSECHPWKSNSCCYQETVSSVSTINEAYGANYHWDRCGPLSQACERFFVQEACFYECEPNAGYFRRFHPDDFNASNPDHNAWELEGMPIKASYCDAWFEACRNDLFCGNGNFFECANIWENHDNSETVIVSEDSGADPALIAGILLAGIVAVVAVIFVAHLVRRERAGAPMFNPLVQDDPKMRDTTGVSMREAGTI